MTGSSPRALRPPDDFGAYLREVRPALDAALAERLASLLAGVSLGDPAGLRAALGAGKKVRGALVCLTAEALGGRREAALPRAAAVELIQAASLLHDDLVDDDRVRRGLPAPWVTEGARRAVLLGDLLFASAIDDVSRLAPEEGAVMARAIARLAEGACAEPLDPEALRGALRAGPPPPGIYARIVRLKTGVLFGAACRVGAASAGADRDAAEGAERYGTLLGEAYQVADDLEDLRRLLSREISAPAAWAPLAPALLELGEGARQRVLGLLSGASPGPEEARRLLRDAHVRLGAMIEERLAGAAAALEGTLPPGPRAALFRRAPEDVIRLFRAGEGDPAGGP